MTLPMIVEVMVDGTMMLPVTAVPNRSYFCNHARRFPKLKRVRESVTLEVGVLSPLDVRGTSQMEVSSPKAVRRCTRVRVEIPISVTSLDRRRPFAEKCIALVVSAQGCGFRSSRPLPPETPILLTDLPGGSTSARVANCLPLGNDGKYFLIGASLYNHGNFWGIADPPEDWGVASQNSTVAGSSSGVGNADSPVMNKKSWPYNLFPSGSETHPGRK